MTPKLTRRKPARTKETVRRSIPAHESWVRGFECIIPGCIAGPVECAHVRNSALTPASERGALGQKPHSKWTVPLCRDHHAEQHRIGEAAFQRRHSLDLGVEAQKFARMSPHKWRWETDEL